MLFFVVNRQSGALCDFAANFAEIFENGFAKVEEFYRKHHLAARQFKIKAGFDFQRLSAFKSDDRQVDEIRNFYLAVGARARVHVFAVGKVYAAVARTLFAGKGDIVFDFKLGRDFEDSGLVGISEAVCPSP